MQAQWRVAINNVIWFMHCGNPAQSCSTATWWWFAASESPLACKPLCQGYTWFYVYAIMWLKRRIVTICRVKPLIYYILNEERTGHHSMHMHNYIIRSKIWLYDVWSNFKYVWPFWNARTLCPCIWKSYYEHCVHSVAPSLNTLP